MVRWLNRYIAMSSVDDNSMIYKTGKRICTSIITIHELNIFLVLKLLRFLELREAIWGAFITLDGAYVLRRQGHAPELTIVR